MIGLLAALMILAASSETRAECADCAASTGPARGIVDRVDGDTECRAPLPTTSPTATADVPACPAQPRLPLGRVTFTMGTGTPTCGLPALPPLSGEVDDLAGGKRLDLGLGCLYVGGGIGTILPGVHLPVGAQSVLDVAGIRGLTLSITASDGSGPADCTRGAGPGKHCLNAQPGTDGDGACTSDEDCAGKVGACDLDARCFFGTPVPVPMEKFSVCMLNALQHDVCGTVDLSTNETKVSASVSSRVYLTGDSLLPCPQCVNGTCSAGQRVGQPCSGGIGADLTTIECPPRDEQFFERLGLNLSSLNTGTSTLDDPTGDFCPGQRTPGAFGGEARSIRESGAPLLSKGIFDLTLVGTFCVPATGNELFDSAADLPAPGAISVPGTIAISFLPRAWSRTSGTRRRPNSAM